VNKSTGAVLLLVVATAALACNVSIPNFRASNRLPPDAETQIRDQWKAGLESIKAGDYIKNYTFEVVGTGELTPEARQKGITSIFCVLSRMEVQVDNGLWKPAVVSTLALATGNKWNTYTENDKNEWLLYGCPLNSYILDFPRPKNTPIPFPTRTPRPMFTPLPPATPLLPYPTLQILPTP
jgi:hypothetical protein